MTNQLLLARLQAMAASKLNETSTTEATTPLESATKNTTKEEVKEVKEEVSAETTEATKATEEVVETTEDAKATEEVVETTEDAKATEEPVETTEATKATEEVVETTEENATEGDNTKKPDNANAALMALMAQRKAKEEPKGRSQTRANANNTKAKEVMMYEHVAPKEGIVYFMDEEVGRIPKQCLIPDANYKKFIRDEIIPHIKQAKMKQFDLRPQGLDWYLEADPTYAENYHKQG